MKNKDNEYYHHETQEKDKNKHMENNKDELILNAAKEEDNSYLDFNKIFDESFEESQKVYEINSKTSPDSTDKIIKFGENSLMKENNTLKPEFSSDLENIKEKKNQILNENFRTSKIEIYNEPIKNSLDNRKNNRIDDLDYDLVQKYDSDAIYKRKNEELQKKINEYNNKYQILAKKIVEYEENTSDLIEMKKEYANSIRKYEEKSGSLDERNEEISNQLKKLKEAREKIIDLSKQIEEKKIDLEKRDENLRKSEKNLEKIKFELEKNKIEFEKNKLEFEIGKSNLEAKIKESEIPKILRESEESNQINKDDIEKKRGKGEILQNLMLNLSHTGNFKYCFLVDGKGMLISEYSQVQSDPIAIGAMFSLIYTAIQRAVKSLNLYELNYFKISSINGDFIFKNINIMNYERSFILLAHYDDSNSIIPDSKQISNKRIVKRILKNLKKDLFEFGNENESLGIFDDLNDRINFLKKKYRIPQEELELTRVNLLNETAIKIKDLFEM